MIIIDAGTSYKYGAFLSDKSDRTILAAFEIFHAYAETTTGKKIRRLRTDRAYTTQLHGETTVNAMVLHTNLPHLIHLLKMDWLSVQSGLQLMMYVPCYAILVLATPIGLKRLPTPFILVISSHPDVTLVIFP